MKFRAHDTFFIRKGWLSKGVKNVIAKPDIFVTKEDNPMDILGIGANMVKALRYWLQAVGLTSESQKGKRIQTLTAFGELIYKNDRYFEEVGTLALLHYKLVSNRDDATAWWYFYNIFSMTEFSKDDFVSSLQGYLKSIQHDTNIAVRSIEDDFSCITNTYLPRYKVNPNRISAENNIDCPLGELGLVDIVNRSERTYRKSAPLISAVDPWIALAIIHDQANGREEIKLNELLIAPCNIGRVFNLDAVSMLDMLYRIEQLGMIKINRAAGSDVITITQKSTFEECVTTYYNSL